MRRGQRSEKCTDNSHRRSCEVSAKRFALLDVAPVSEFSRSFDTESNRVYLNIFLALLIDTPQRLDKYVNQVFASFDYGQVFLAPDQRLRDMGQWRNEAAGCGGGLWRRRLKQQNCRSSVSAVLFARHKVASASDASCMLRIVQAPHRRVTQVIGVE